MGKRIPAFLDRSAPYVRWKFMPEGIAFIALHKKPTKSKTKKPKALKGRI